MKSRTHSRFLVAALAAGSLFAAAPAVYAEDAQQPAAEQQAAQAQSPFNEKTVEEHVMATIERFEKGDVAGLQAEATQEMRQQLTEERVKDARAQFAPKFDRVSVGKTYMTAGQEKDAWFVVCEIAVGYNATTVIYRLSYDANMNLAGFLVR